MVTEAPSPASSLPEPSPAPKTTEATETTDTKGQQQATVALQNAGTSSAVENYLTRLSRHLARFYEYPRRARRLGQEGTPVIVFEFRRDGTLLAQSLRTGSGHKLLDEAALAMLRQAAPLPEVPEDMSGQSFSYALPVRFSLR